MIELARGATGLIRMEGNQTILSRPPDSKTGKESEDIKAFTFDKSYWSADKNAPNYADQQTVYNDLGEDLLNHAFDGYNCCIFACKLIKMHVRISSSNIVLLIRWSNWFRKIILNGNARMGINKEMS